MASAPPQHVKCRANAVLAPAKAAQGAWKVGRTKEAGRTVAFIWAVAQVEEVTQRSHLIAISSVLLKRLAASDCLSLP